MVTQANPDSGQVKTALLSFPEFFCELTEMSAPSAYIGFALQLDGRVSYFRTKTTCQDFTEAERRSHRVIFGEQVILYGGKTPTKLRRENGELYKIEPNETSTTRSYFLQSVSITGYENPKYLPDNPHPEAIITECRLLTDSSERNLCLLYQAVIQNNAMICDELTGSRRDKCLEWVDNIKKGKINQ